MALPQKCGAEKRVKTSSDWIVTQKCWYCQVGMFRSCETEDVIHLEKESNHAIRRNSTKEKKNKTKLTDKEREILCNAVAKLND